MKLTIVIDTDDERGMMDTYKIVNHFYKKLPSQRSELSSRKVRFAKIPFIKMLRNHANEVKAEEERGGDGHGLRFNKQFAERIFDEQEDTI